MVSRAKLSYEKKLEMYNRYVLGAESREDLMDAYDIGQTTFYQYIKDVREAETRRRWEMGQSQIVAGDKRNGRLLSTTDPHRYEGTCVIGGKSKSRTFTAVNAKNAQAQWETWCQSLRDEDEFMAGVERRDGDDLARLRRRVQELEAQIEADESLMAEMQAENDVKDGTIAELSKAVDVKNETISDLEERVRNSDAEVKKIMDERRGTDDVVAKTELGEPKLSSWLNDNGSFKVTWCDKPVYVIWAKTDQPKLYGAYDRMESALKEVDKVNEIAAVLGQEGAFQIEEVVWR